MNKDEMRLLIMMVHILTYSNLCQYAQIFVTVKMLEAKLGFLSYLISDSLLANVLSYQKLYTSHIV